MNPKRIVILSVVGGLVITVLSGLVWNTPPMLLGAVRYGYPVAWLIRLILAPEYFPWRVDVLGLAVDAVAWAAAVGVVLSASTRILKGPQV